MRWRSWSVLIALGLTAFAARTAHAQARATPITAADLTAFDRAKAETLLRRRLPCLGCHTLGGEGGKLGPDLTTVRSRRDADYVARIIADPQHTVPGTLMPHTPMPTPWRALIIQYLGGNAASANAASIETKAQSADSNGAALYGRFCVGCHGSRGGGDGPNASSLPVPPARHASRDAMAARPDDALYDTIAGGGEIMNRSARMPAYGTTLSPAQIRALVRHIRSLCECTGPAWSTDGERRDHD